MRYERSSRIAKPFASLKFKISTVFRPKNIRFRRAGPVFEGQPTRPAYNVPTRSRSLPRSSCCEYPNLPSLPGWHCIPLRHIFSNLLRWGTYAHSCRANSVGQHDSPSPRVLITQAQPIRLQVKLTATPPLVMSASSRLVICYMAAQRPRFTPLGWAGSDNRIT